MWVNWLTMERHFMNLWISINCLRRIWADLTIVCSRISWILNFLIWSTLVYWYLKVGKTTGLHLNRKGTVGRIYWYNFGSNWPIWGWVPGYDWPNWYSRLESYPTDSWYFQWRYANPCSGSSFKIAVWYQY